MQMTNKRRQQHEWVAVCIGLLAVTNSIHAQAKSSKPNIVLFIADDVSAEDICADLTARATSGTTIVEDLPVYLPADSTVDVRSATANRESAPSTDFCAWGPASGS